MRKILTEEILNNMVEDCHNGVGLEELSSTYGFQEQTIQKNFCKLGLSITKSNARKFTKDEIDSIVLDYKNGMKPYELATKYQRKSGTIIGKLKSIGVYEDKNYRFTEKEIELLKQYYCMGDWESISKLLPNVSKYSIYTKMSKLNVHMDDYFWSENDVLKLKELYTDIGNNTKELVKLFNNKPELFTLIW